MAIGPGHSSPSPPSGFAATRPVRKQQTLLETRYLWLSMAKAQPRARTQCASIKKNPLAFLQRDSALVKDNSVIIALMLLYVAVVTTVLARTQTGQFFLKIEWFDSIALFFGGVFCILCMGIQFFFPKLHPPFRAKNYIQFFIVLLLLSPYRSAFASYKQYISSVAPYSWDKTFMHSRGGSGRGCPPLPAAGGIASFLRRYTSAGSRAACLRAARGEKAKVNISGASSGAASITASPPFCNLPKSIS